MTLSDAQISHLLAMFRDAIDFELQIDGEIKEEDGAKYVSAKAGSMDIDVEMKIFLPDETVQTLLAK